MTTPEGSDLADRSPEARGRDLVGLVGREAQVRGRGELDGGDVDVFGDPTSHPLRGDLDQRRPDTVARMGQAADVAVVHPAQRQGVPLL